MSIGPGNLRGEIAAEAPKSATPVSEDLSLLERHRPWLLWDSQDDFRAIAAESICANPGNVLEHDGHIVAGTRGEGGRELTLALLADTGENLTFDGTSRLLEAPMPFAAARRLQREEAFAGQVYGRVQRGGDRIWLQYWMWLYYNPKNLLGRGRHEGDWEMVQVRLDAASLDPTAVTYAQHGRGEHKDNLSEVEWEFCRDPCAGIRCRHPRVYVAPLSHASYFEAGTHFYLPGTDTPDGSVFEGLPRVISLEGCDWRTWPGRWGAQKGRLGASPRTPGCQLDQWDAERFERRARTRKPRERRWLWRLGQRTYPRTPAVEIAELEGDMVVVTWRAERQRWRKPRWLLVTVHDAELPERIVRRRTVRMDGTTGETRIPLQPDLRPDRVLVQATAFNRLRQRSDASPQREALKATTADTGAPRARDSWSPRVWKAFQRDLLEELSKSGAATIEELERRRLQVCELALDRTELVALVDSARRARLVEPLGHEVRADGATPSGVEWVSTEEGGRRITPFTKWIRGGIGLIPSAALGLAVSSLWPWMKEQDPFWLIVGGVLCLEAILFAGILLYRYWGGAGPRAICNQWSRHAVELPMLNRWYTGWWTRIGLAGGLIMVTAFVLDVAWAGAPPLALLVAIAGGFGLQLLYISRADQLAQLIQEAKAAHEIATTRATPKQPRRRRRRRNRRASRGRRVRRT